MSNYERGRSNGGGVGLAAGSCVFLGLMFFNLGSTLGKVGEHTDRKVHDVQEYNAELRDQLSGSYGAIT